MVRGSEVGERGEGSGGKGGGKWVKGGGTWGMPTPLSTPSSLPENCTDDVPRSCLSN